jgi:hypothetical protein
MSQNNALATHNSVTSLNFNSPKKRRVAHPPSSARNRPQSARVHRNAKRFRQKALNVLKQSINKLSSMTNEQFNKKVRNHLRTFKQLKNYGKLSINNIPVLIAIQNSALIRRQVWRNVTPK